MEQETDAHIKNEVTKAPLLQAMVQHFLPNYTAQSDGSVIAPSFIGSKVEGNININIISNGQGCTVSTDELNNNNTNGNDALQPQDNKITECQKKLKAMLKRNFSHFLEGIPTNANKIALNEIYTDLYITEGGSGQVNNEHEVVRIETRSKARVSKEKSIHFNDLFVPPPGRESHVRTVITRGVAGIGKTVSVNKFTLDWAEDRENTNLDFVFPLSFRELNLVTEKISLVKLISNFFGDIKDAAIFINDENKMLFILDGLDESHLSLDFNKSEIMSDVTQPNKIAVLLANLIRGRLLPLALVWITSRPVASSQIPLEYVDLVTEVRGFNNPQKDDYFRRTIADESLADQVIAHVKSCRSLYIMCHIPVFCWMVGKLANEDSNDMPKSLTQMYIHFLSFFVEDIKRRQPGRQESNADSVRTDLLSLGKLAFKELEKGHQPFYESDLIMNGISATQASGVYTQIFNEVLIPCQEKMFCFVHLSIKEFFAALYVFLTFHNDNDNVLIKKSQRFLFRESSELILYKKAVKKALRCKEGHFDIFLRFLLGLSLECNQALLKHLMTNNRTHARTRPEIIKYIKRIRAAMSPDRCPNLFHCLNELNDPTLVEEIQSV